MLMAVLNCLFESLNQILRFVYINYTIHFKYILVLVSKTPTFAVYHKELFVFMTNCYNWDTPAMPSPPTVKLLRYTVKLMIATLMATSQRAGKKKPDI